MYKFLLVSVLCLFASVASGQEPVVVYPVYQPPVVVYHPPIYRPPVIVYQPVYRPPVVIYQPYYRPVRPRGFYFQW